MRPSTLKPGQRVMIQPTISTFPCNHGTFIRRVPRTSSRPAYSVIRVDEFAGLNGPEDLGIRHFPITTPHGGLFSWRHNR